MDVHSGLHARSVLQGMDEMIWSGSSVEKNNPVAADYKKQVADGELSLKQRHLGEYFIVDYKLVTPASQNEIIAIEGSHVAFAFVFGGQPLSRSLKTDPQSSFNGHVNIYGSGNGHYTFPLKPGYIHTKVLIIMSQQYFLDLFRHDSFNRYFSAVESIRKSRSYRSAAFMFHMDVSMRHIIDKIRRPRVPEHLMIPYMDACIRSLVLLLHEQELEKGEKVVMAEDETIQKLMKARSILDTQFQNPPTIKELSKMILLNELKLKKGFKELFDMTIHNYQIRVRMEQACQMMAEQNILIFEIAMRLGFKDTSHFIQVFKKYYGYTPKEFHKNMQPPFKVP